MSKYGIETFDDLYADREKLQGEMDKLIAYRTSCKTKSARASPAEKETLREEKSRHYGTDNGTQKIAKTEQRALRNAPGKSRRKQICSMPMSTEQKRKNNTENHREGRET